MLENIRNRFISDRNSYVLQPAEYYGRFYNIICLDEDLLIVSKWQDHKDLENYKYVGNDIVKLYYVDYNEEFDFDKLEYIKRELLKNNNYFWGNQLELYINLDDIIFSEIKELFK